MLNFFFFLTLLFLKTLNSEKVNPGNSLLPYELSGPKPSIAGFDYRFRERPEVHFMDFHSACVHCRLLVAVL